MILLLAAWLAVWLVLGRYAMLDDCFIHLRYAAFLLHSHTITYDGIHRSFGTSSPLYVVLLALLRRPFPGPMLPKALSTFAYLVLISSLLAFLLRSRLSPLARILTAMLLFCLASPMGIRWLTDGMETPIHVLFAFLLALLCDREMHTTASLKTRAPLLILFGFMMTTLRIESATLIFLATITIFAARLHRERAAHKSIVVLQSSPLALGALLALATVRFTLGSFLPDTALAKTGGFSLKPLGEVAHLLLSSLNLGVSLFLLWLFALILLLRAATSGKLSAPAPLVVVLGNAILPVILTLACVRGQFVQGIRYLLWCIVFSIVWNICQLTRVSLEIGSWPLSFRDPTLRRIQLPLTALAVLMLALLPIEAYFVLPTLHARGLTFTQMRAAPLALLSHDKIMSADVGYIGYFSGSPVCDVEGLVDGRSFAAQTKRQRIHACSTSDPDVLFLNAFQLSEASVFLDLNQWSVCRTFDYAGVTTADRHYLMVPQRVAATKCALLQSSPYPYQAAAAPPTHP